MIEKEPERGNKVRFDPSILDKRFFKGRGLELFGAIDEITKAGNFYSYNIGFDEGYYHLLVLDIAKKQFSYHTSYNSEQHNWISGHPLIIGKSSISNHEYSYILLPCVIKFIEKLGAEIPNMKGREFSKVSQAMREAVRPMLLYFEDVSKKAQANYGTLESTFHEFISGSISEDTL